MHLQLCHLNLLGSLRDTFEPSSETNFGGHSVFVHILLYEMPAIHLYYCLTCSLKFIFYLAWPWILSSNSIWLCAISLVGTGSKFMLYLYWIDLMVKENLYLDVHWDFKILYNLVCYLKIHWPYLFFSFYCTLVFGMGKCILANLDFRTI